MLVKDVVSNALAEMALSPSPWLKVSLVSALAEAFLALGAQSFFLFLIHFFSSSEGVA